MSRIIAYRPFIEVRLENDDHEPIDAFEVRATPETRERLSRYRLLARPRQDGAALYYRYNPASSPELFGEITTRERFSFTLHLRRPDFFQRHLPDLTEATGPGIHLDNLDPAGAILPHDALLSAGTRVDTADAVEIGRRLFPVNLDLTASSPASVEARDPISGSVVVAEQWDPISGTLVEAPLSEEVIAPAGAAAASVALDFTHADGVLFHVAEVPAGPLDRRTYADDDAASSGATGVIDIYWEAAQNTVPTPDGVVYHAVFERRAS